MADGVDLAAGVAGLLTLTIEVSRLAITYVTKVYNATDNIVAILQELKGLKTVLGELDSLFDLVDVSELKSVGASAVLSLPACIEYKIILTELRIKLEKYKSDDPGFSKWKLLYWPLDEGQSKETLEKLHKYFLLFQTALSRDIFLGVFKTLKNTEAIRAVHEDNRVAQALKWLSACNMSQKQFELYSKHQPGTGRWFINHPTLQSWLKDGGPCTFLWCPGAPGSGKTVMMATLVNHIKSEMISSSTKHGLAYMFCDHQEKPKASGIIACLARQLASQSATIHPKLWDMYEDLGTVQQRPDANQLESLTRALCTNFDRVFLIVDALDECTDRFERRALITTLEALRTNTIKIIVTSRPNLEDVQEQLQGHPSIEIVASSADVREYLVHQLRTVLRKRLTTELEEQVIQEISARVTGMFLMAVLLVEQISHERTTSRLLKTLQMLPAKLEEAYSVSIRRIADQGESDKNLAMRILQWVSYAKRPLRIEECLHALAVEVTEDNPAAELDLQNLLEPRSLIDVCAGLIRIEDTENTVRFVHSTAREFFERKRSELFSDAEVDMSITCLTYFQYNVFSEGPCDTDDLFQHRVRTHPFIEYAAHHWMDHVRLVSNNHVEELAYTIIMDAKLRGSMLQVMCAPAYRLEGYSQKYPKHTTALHTAARVGLTDIARRILLSGDDINGRAIATGRTPLQEAAKYGYVDMVRLLLAEGAEVNDTSPKGSALQIATGRGWSDVVPILLEHHADANLNVEGEGMGYRSIDPHSGSALHRAAAIGHFSIVQMLIKNGADPNIRDYSKGTALHQASIKGYKDVCNLLLENGAAVDIPDSSGRTPLQQAAAYGQAQIVQLLLDHGADVNARDFCGGLALQRAATNGDIATTRLLISQGADPDIPGQFGGSSLQRAAALGHLEIMELLLEYGARPDAPDQYGGTALQRATANTREEEVKLLLRYGASPNSLNSTGGTPLQWACSVGHRAIAEMLLQAGGDPVAAHPSVEGRGTALDRAMRNGHQTIVELLSH